MTVNEYSLDLESSQSLNGVQGVCKTEVPDLKPDDGVSQSCIYGLYFRQILSRRSSTMIGVKSLLL